MTLVPSPPSRIAFAPNWPARITFVALALYVGYACSIIDISKSPNSLDGRYFLAPAAPLNLLDVFAIRAMTSQGKRGTPWVILPAIASTPAPIAKTHG